MADASNLDRRWDKAVRSLRSGDKSGALFLFNVLANDGEMAAYREIASIYEFGGGGVDKDINRAIHWYRKAVDLGNDAFGCLGLARLYFYGKTGGVDYRKALSYLQEIEENDIPLVYLMLGRIYKVSAQGLTPDFELSERYYRKAASTGNVYAVKELGLLRIERGKLLSGSILWIKGFINAIKIGARDRFDSRLKGY